MKHKIHLLLCFLFLSIGVFSQNIPSYVPTNGLVGWWPFNGNANDESGNGNQPTFLNNITFSKDKMGYQNKAIFLNGTSYIKFNPIKNSSNNILGGKIPLTISFWAQTSNPLTNGILSINADTSLPIGHPNTGHVFEIDINSTQACYTVGPSFRAVSHVGTATFSNAIDSTWHHYSFVFGGGGNFMHKNIKFYVDGQLYTNLGCAHNWYYWEYYLPKMELFIGSNVAGAIKGSLDDIAIYNRALTQAEITALYNGPTYAISANAGRNGSITPAGNTTVNGNTVQRYTFTPNTGYLVDSVTVDGNKVDSLVGYTFSNVTSNHTISVTFKALNIPSYVPTNGLVGWWPFNGNANDESGNGNHGTVNGATLTNDRNGIAGKAYSFDGVNDNIGVLNSNHPKGNIEITYSLWVNPSTLSSIDADAILCVGSITDPNKTSAIFLRTSYIYYTQSHNDAQHNFSTPINSWTHILITKQSNNLTKLYINGNFIDQVNVNNGQDITNTNLNFGFNGNVNHLSGEFYNGSLDDIAIYNRALTQKEVTALYTGVVTNDIVASSGANGSISPSGTTSVNSGTNQTYTFTPNPGYWVDSVFVNGVQVPTASSYTFNNVTSDQTIRVTYRSLAAALAAANICANDTLVSTVNLPVQSNVRATTYYSNIYLFNQNNTGNAYKYNVNDRKYTAITDKPTACIECGVAEANGKVYCFNTNGTTEAYDIATNAWQTQTNQPSSSSSSVYAASVNNKIYVLCTNNNQNTFIQFNPQTNSYTALANPTTNSSQSRLVAYNNKLYKIGGTDNNSQPTSSVEVYNPSNNTWTAMPDLPIALTQVGATYYDNKLYVFGGKQNNNTNSNKVYVFDFTSNAWYAQSNTQNTNRTNIEAKTANNMVFLFGGADTTNSQTNQAQRYFCKDQLCTCKWAEYECNGVSSDVPCPTSSLYRPGTVFCNGYATKVVDVTNPITGKTWMDRNLGASRAATSSADADAYGDLYQWGRAADGHQCRNSGTTSTLSSTDQPGHGNFIIAPNSPSDWRNPQKNNLWQGVNGTNNPCPSGYRLPNVIELENEKSSWTQINNLGAFGSVLKLLMPGHRLNSDGSLNNVGNRGLYWSNTFNGNWARPLDLGIGYAGSGNDYRANGFSVRCIKD